MIFFGYLSSIIYGALVLLLAALAYRLGLARPYCRKLVHVLIGGEYFVLSYFFGTSLHFLLVALIFTALLFFNYKRRLLPMISSDADNDLGTVYFGISMSALALAVHFLPDALHFFGAAVLVTSLGDGAAGIVGQSIEKYNPRLLGNKSLLGSVAMLVASGLALGPLHSYLGISLGRALALALFATGVELLCRRGTDNLALPLLSFLFLLMTDGGAAFSGAHFGLALLPLLVALFLARRALTVGGCISAVVVALCLVLALGNSGLLFLLVYFALAHLADRVARRRENAVEEKGDCRDEGQVLANGFVGALCALLYTYFGSTAFLLGVLTAFSESLGDSTASGFGVLSRRTVDIFRARRVPTGESGGMSLFGTLAALGFSFLLSFVGAWLFALPFWGALLCAACAFLGSVVDSALGSLLQQKRICTVCGTLTERRTHCGAPTDHARGLRWLGNDLVNLLSTLFSVLFCILFSSLI